jgi:hypothetical protein
MATPSSELPFAAWVLNGQSHPALAGRLNQAYERSRLAEDASATSLAVCALANGPH